MKKFFVMALIVMLALLIFGCGQKDDKKGEQDQPPVEKAVEAAPDTVETMEAPDSTDMEDHSGHGH